MITAISLEDCGSERLSGFACGNLVFRLSSTTFCLLIKVKIQLKFEKGWYFVSAYLTWFLVSKTYDNINFLVKELEFASKVTFTVWRRLPLLKDVEEEGKGC